MDFLAYSLKAVSDILRFGKGGPILKVSSGTLTSRNTVDGADAPLGVGTPSSDNHATPRTYVTSEFSSGVMWAFDVATGDANPGSGKFRLNNIVQGSATFAYVNYVSSSGANLKNTLLGLLDTDRIYFNQNGTKARNHVFKVTGAPTDATTYCKIPITSESTGTDLQDTYIVSLSFYFEHPSSGTAAGAAAEMWTFNTATSGDPGSGKCLLDNATQHSATYAHLSKTSDSGADFGAQLLALLSGDRFYVQQNDDVTRYHVFRVTGTPSDQTTYVKIPIIYESYGADLANTKKVTFSWQYTKSAISDYDGEIQEFSILTADADPGAGKFRLNHATQASATYAFMDDTVYGGATIRNQLLALKGGEYVYLQQRNDSTRYHLYKVMGPVLGPVVAATGYVKIPISSVSAGAALQDGAAVLWNLHYTNDELGMSLRVPSISVYVPPVSNMIVPYSFEVLATGYLEVAPTGIFEVDPRKGREYPPGYIDGLQVEITGDDTCSILPGVARCNSDSCNMKSTGTLIANITSSGAGGLDTGSPANTAYYIHVICKSSTGICAAMFSLSEFSPALPSGYAAFRRVGYVYRSGGVFSPKTIQKDRGIERLVQYTTDVDLGNTTSGTYQTISTGDTVCPRARSIRLGAGCYSGGGYGYTCFRGGDVTSGDEHIVEVGQAGDYMWEIIRLSLNSSRQFQMRSISGADRADAYLWGYYDELITG